MATVTTVQNQSAVLQSLRFAKESALVIEKDFFNTRIRKNENCF